MSYRDDYLTVVQPGSLETIEAVLQDRDGFETYGILECGIKHDKDGLPFVLLTSTFEGLSRDGDMVCAQLLLLYVEESERHFPNLKGDFLYLPVICVADSYPSAMSGKFSMETSLEHEIIHLRDILDLYDNDPSYQAKRWEFGLAHADTREQLVTSFDLDMFELFHLEPKAYQHTYQCGDKYIYEFAFGLEVRMSFATESEFLRVQIVRNIVAVIGSYRSKMAELNVDAPSLLKKAVGKYGQGVFGPNAYDSYQDVRQKYAGKFLGSILTGTKEVKF